MGVLLKLIDVILFFFLLVIAIGAPLVDFQVCLPSSIFPEVLIDLKLWYTQEYGDYFFTEKPHFFVGLVWLELVFGWPLSIACLYGIVARKSWLATTCLLYGANILAAMAAILSELVGSGKASDKQLKLYLPFLGLAVLIIFRGLVPHFHNLNEISTTPAERRKKIA